jgi:DNA-binding transcriptional MerR regulator
MLSPGEVAGALGVSVSSIRNWTEQVELQQHLSDAAKREGEFSTAKERRYTQQDLYVLNTVMRRKTRVNSWADVAKMLEEGTLDTDLPATASMVVASSAEAFADALLLRQQVNSLQQDLDRARAETERVRAEKAENDERLHQEINRRERVIGGLEAELRLAREQLAKKEGKGGE